MAVEEHVIDLIPAYALGALDAEEEPQVVAHLEACASCREELLAYRLVVDELALATPPRQPPPHIKRQILQRIHQPAVSTSKQNWLSQFFQNLPRLSPTWGILSLVLILFLAGGNFFLFQQLRQSQDEWRTVKLSGTDSAPHATGLLVVSHDGAFGTLVVDGLPPLDASMQYQLWLIKDGQRTSGGLFSVDTQGYSSLWVKSARPLDTYQGFGVTIEPQGGSPGPTGAKVLGGQF